MVFCGNPEKRPGFGMNKEEGHDKTSLQIGKASKKGQPGNDNLHDHEMTAAEPRVQAAGLQVISSQSCFRSRSPMFIREIDPKQYAVFRNPNAREPARCHPGPRCVFQDR